MEDNGIRGPSSFDSDGAADESFDTLFPVIVSTVRRECATTVIGPVDCDDIVQEVSIRVWKYWLVRPILYPASFIQRVTHNFCIDLQRRWKPSLSQPFPEDDEGESLEDKLLWREASPEDDPEWYALNNEGATETTGQVADAIAGLSPRQQDAAICTLKDRAYEWSRMAAALEVRGINANMEWPPDPDEKRCLQASFSPAKLRIARSMGEELSSCQRS